MKQKWTERSTKDRILNLARIVTSLLVVVFSLLQLFAVWDRGMHVAVPLMGVNELLSSIQEWNKNRGLAIFGLCCGIFLLGITAALLLLS